MVNALLACVVVPGEDDLLGLGLAMTDGGLLTVHAAAVTENDATASLEAAACVVQTISAWAAVPARTSKLAIAIDRI